MLILFAKISILDVWQGYELELLFLVIVKDLPSSVFSRPWTIFFGTDYQDTWYYDIVSGLLRERNITLNLPAFSLDEINQRLASWKEKFIGFRQG